MGGSKQWAKSTTGPDAMDVMAMMAAIGTLHSGHVALTVSPLGTGFCTGGSITAGVIFDKLPGSSLPSGVTATVEWPSQEHSTFWGAAYNCLWMLDHEISQVYKNEKLWE